MMIIMPFLFGIDRNVRYVLLGILMKKAVFRGFFEVVRNVRYVPIDYFIFSISSANARIMMTILWRSSRVIFLANARCLFASCSQCL